MKRFLGVLLVLVVILVGSLMAYFKETPVELWDRLREYVETRLGNSDEAETEKSPSSPAASEPVPAQPPAVQSIPEADGDIKKEVSPTTEEERELELSPLVWLQKNPRYAPREVTVKTNQRVDLPGQGEDENSWFEMYAGSVAQVREVREESVMVLFGSASVEVPISETNLEELAAERMAQAKQAAIARKRAAEEAQRMAEEALKPEIPQQRDDVYLWNEAPN